LETASGLGSNRMTARSAVRLLRGLHRKAAELGLGLRDLLPVPGCDPGPAPRMFPSLAVEPLAGCCPVKSGTLVSTDGGVAVLSGAFRSTAGEEILFCVAAPEAGSGLRWWRQEEERWLLRLMESVGGAVGGSCGAPLVLSDEHALVETVELEARPDLQGDGACPGEG